jgi:hypothetical protein
MSTTTPPRPESVDVPTLLAEFDASRQTPATFARSRGLAPWRVYNAPNRRKALARRAAVGTSATRPALLPVQVVANTPTTRRTSGLEIELAGGHRLRIGCASAAHRLRIGCASAAHRRGLRRGLRRGPAATRGNDCLARSLDPSQQLLGIAQVAPSGAAGDRDDVAGNGRESARYLDH